MTSASRIPKRDHSQPAGSQGLERDDFESNGVAAKSSTEKGPQSNVFKGNGFVAALRVELFTTSRTRLPWLLVAAPALAVALRLLLVKITTSNQALRASVTGDADVQTINGYGYMVDGFSTGLTLLYLIFIAYAAFSFAIDRDHGVVRHLVIRRVSRRALIGAKFLVFNILALVSVAAVIIVALVLSRLFWDLGPVVEDGFEIIGEPAIREEIRMGLTLALLPLPACLALGLLISVCAGSATQAVALAVGITLVVDIFKNLLGKGAHYLYAAFQPSLIDQSYLSDVARIVRGYSDVLIDQGVYQLNLWIPLPQAILFVILALVVVGRRKL
ncbi:MAG: ABC transporter permease [Cellvibrionaceae bacterium]